MSKTLDAMKQIRDKLIKGGVLCEVAAVGMLDDLIKQEEAQTVEPKGWVIVTSRGSDRVRFENYYAFNAPNCPVNADGSWKAGHPSHFDEVSRAGSLGYVVSQELLFTHPAPATEPTATPRLVNATRSAQRHVDKEEAQTVEPAFYVPPERDEYHGSDFVNASRTEKAGWIPLFTRPTQPPQAAPRVPMTEDDLRKAAERNSDYDDFESFVEMARDIERLHGIR